MADAPDSKSGDSVSGIERRFHSARLRRSSIELSETALMGRGRLKVPLVPDLGRFNGTVRVDPFEFRGEYALWSRSPAPAS
jgi:hypothetical protein